jgi:hypothetical protein
MQDSSLKISAIPSRTLPTDPQEGRPVRDGRPRVKLQDLPFSPAGPACRTGPAKSSFEIRSGEIRSGEIRSGNGLGRTTPSSHPTTAKAFRSRTGDSAGYQKPEPSRRSAVCFGMGAGGARLGPASGHPGRRWNPVVKGGRLRGFCRSNVKSLLSLAELEQKSGQLAAAPSQFASPAQATPATGFELIARKAEAGTD